MPLYLGNKEIERLLTPAACLEAVEDAYTAYANGKAINRPRTDMWVSRRSDPVRYIFKSFEGGLAEQGVVALRLCSNRIRWKEVGGTIRKEKIPSAKGNRWVGLIFLFSTETSELIAIMQDGYIQKMRVAATTALSIKWMARKDARVLALYGSGWQAEGAVELAALVRDLKEIRVFSPTREHREAFATRMGRKTGIPIRAVDDPREAARGADILLAATDAVTPVVPDGCLEPGMHISNIKVYEFSPAMIRNADIVVVNSRRHAPINYLMGEEQPLETHDPMPDPSQEDRAAPYLRAGLDFHTMPELTDVIAGRVEGRSRPEQVTCFLNNIGIGIQFAGTAKKVYDLARVAGIGQELPDEMFSQDVHD